MAVEKVENKTTNDAEAQELEVADLSPSNSSKNDEKVAETVGAEEDDGYIHHEMNWRLFLSLTAMAFLWVGSQIPLYLFGSVLPLIYSDIGGVDRYVWFVIGYLIPNAALCPFVGALSDMYGRRNVAMLGQVTLIVGPVITATAQTMNIAICGQVFSGLGAGLNELIALAGTGELVPVAKRGKYVGAIVFAIIPFCPSALWGQLIAAASNWRYNGILIGVWNFLGLIFVAVFYKDPPRKYKQTKMEILRKIDYVGGLLSIGGCLLFMMGMQWGAVQYKWHSAHVLAPFILGIFMIIAFFVWEVKFAPHPMAPPAIFSLEKRTMIIILVITFVSGGNFFVLLMMWPSQIYNVYGPGPVLIGVRTLPMGFGIIAGSFIALALLPYIRGRIKELMIVATVMMTAFCGAMSVGTPDNINALYAIVLFASLGCGAVIIPASIIAQIICPPELIATITSITLAVRYLGGAVAFTAYYNAVESKYTLYATPMVAVDGIIKTGIVAPENLDVVTELVTLVGQFRFKELQHLIDTNPLVNRKDVAFDIITRASQEAFSLAYRYPYWISIAFGGTTCILAFFLKDIRKFMTMQITAGAVRKD